MTAADYALPPVNHPRLTCTEISSSSLVENGCTEGYEGIKSGDGERLERGTVRAFEAGPAAGEGENKGEVSLEGEIEPGAYKAQSGWADILAAPVPPELAHLSKAALKKELRYRARQARKGDVAWKVQRKAAAPHKQQKAVYADAMRLTGPTPGSRTGVHAAPGGGRDAPT